MLDAHAACCSASCPLNPLLVWSSQLLALWNASLAVMSVWLLVWLLAELRHNYVHTVDSSLWEMSCDHRQRMQFTSHRVPLYFIFLSKYAELFDTVLLCLRARPTPFIHVYHHAITSLCTCRLAICDAWSHHSSSE